MIYGSDHIALKYRVVEGAQITSVPLAAGTVIGAYRVIEQIGEGGMGSVWLAEHAMLGRRAAIKVLHPMFSGREDLVTRFFNEARAATAISHPGIVQVFDFGNHTDGSAYIVMELLDGEPLDQRLHREGRLAVGDALRILRQVASALGAAHARGITHRDLKPENIFIVHDLEVASGERAKILDFGIAKLGGDQAGGGTQASAVMGTPMYMSPEQCRGAGEVDQRSDIYSLGCVLLTLVTGQPPFEAVGAGEFIAMHLTQPAPRASSRLPGISPAVDELIARCLEKDPARRFASGTELAAAIGSLPGQSMLTPVPPRMAEASPPTVVGTPTTLTGSSGSIRVPTTPSRRRGVVIGGAVGLAVAAAIAWAATKDPTPTRPASTTPVTPPDDLPELAKVKLRAALAAFTRWSPNHAGAACPRASELVGDAHELDDPWGHAITITCTDQPAGQIVGAISNGPDGAPGTADDLASWQLDAAATSLVSGPRWGAGPASGSAAVVATPVPVVKKPTSSTTSTKPASAPKHTAVRVDANGIPLQR
jgi:serine/threonine protein kinase